MRDDSNTWLILGLAAGVVVGQQLRMHARIPRAKRWLQRTAWPIVARVESPIIARTIDEEWEGWHEGSA